MNISKKEAEEFKERLVLSVINYRENVSRLQDFPFCQRGEFAVLAQFCVGEKNGTGQYTACLTVSKNMLEKLDLTEEALFGIACKNSREMFPGEIKRLEDINGVTMELRADGIIAPEVFVFTNEQRFNGAATLFYQPDLLSDLCGQIGKENLALLPTGANEIYCIGLEDGEKEDLQEYQKLFEEMLKELDKKDHIANNVLCFNGKSQSIQEINGESYDVGLMAKEVNINKRIVGHGR
ncbi:hypothetical protein D7V86_15165 [bacterium D16-51]|nr:hypothetical protein D7V96_20580 [bacterium D16-59]RKI58765.1 hypothetical protein D7V86_15165 [bacterium D16-51]